MVFAENYTKSGKKVWKIPKTHYEQGKLGIQMEFCIGNSEYRDGVTSGSKYVITFLGDKDLKPCTLVIMGNDKFKINNCLGKHNTSAEYGKEEWRKTMQSFEDEKKKELTVRQKNRERKVHLLGTDWLNS